jgi:histidinol-phosphate phosphatase family protein
MGTPINNHTNIAFVLVGGFGTRLKALFPETPKPLVSLGGVTFLTSLLSALKENGIKKVYLLTGYKGDDFHNYVSKNPVAGISIEISQENEPLGSAGAVGLAYQTILKNSNDLASVLVVNGDTWFEGELKEFINAPLDSDYRIMMSYKNPADRYGLVELDGKNQILAFKEKILNSSGWVHSGFAILSKALLQKLPQDKFCSLEKDFFPKFKGVGITGEGQFFDFGVPEDYLELNRDRWVQELTVKESETAKHLVKGLEELAPIEVGDERLIYDAKSDSLAPAINKSENQVVTSISKKDVNLLKDLNLKKINPTLLLPKVKGGPKRPALFLDRDGTLIDHIHYLRDPEMVSLIPGAGEVLRAHQKAGWKIIVVTNQSGVGRGLFNWEVYEKVHERMLELLKAQDVEVDWTFAASYFGSSQRWTGRAHKWLRKPFNGIAKLSEKVFNVDLANSVMVGDSHVDAGFAMMSGLKKVYWIGGNLEDLKKNPPEFKLNPKTEVEFVKSIAQVKIPN